MSFVIDRKDLDAEWKSYIKKECNIWEKTTLWNKVPNAITIFNVSDKKQVILPLSLWNEMLDDFPNDFKFDKIKVPFLGVPQENDDKDQKTVLATAIKHLESKHSVLLALRTGFGKTFSSLYLICHFGLKTVLLCHSTTIQEQWISEAKKWCPDMNIQIVKSEKKKYGGSAFDPNAHVYVMGVIKCSHYDSSEFKNIGMVIVDEAHLTFTQTFSSALLKFSPKYLIGLSATPDRRDGMHKLLYPFFGPKEEFIVRHQVKTFTVIKYLTKYKPIVRSGFNGTVDWNIVTRSIECNTSRQKEIVNICQKYPDHKILILCKRVCAIIGCENYSKCTCENNSLSKGLIPLFKENGENVDYRAEMKKNHDEECRILIGTTGKLGVGYDSKRTILIMACDVTDIRQNEGRIRADNNIVYDLVDNFTTFEKHWKLRQKWYKERGADIQIEDNSAEN